MKISLLSLSALFLNPMKQRINRNNEEDKRHSIETMNRHAFLVTSNQLHRVVCHANSSSSSSVSWTTFIFFIFEREWSFKNPKESSSRQFIVFIEHLSSSSLFSSIHCLQGLKESGDRKRRESAFDSRLDFDHRRKRKRLKLYGEDVTF